MEKCVLKRPADKKTISICTGDNNEMCNISTAEDENKKGDCKNCDAKMLCNKMKIDYCRAMVYLFDTVLSFRHDDSTDYYDNVAKEKIEKRLKKKKTK